MTQHYIGTKNIKAQPMTRFEYNDYRGWALPVDENGNDEGYLVEYLDGGASNHPSHAGYISWSPKAQFDAAYLPLGSVEHLLPHAQRVVGEQAQLQDKVIKLRAFVGSSTFMALGANERGQLTYQLATMETYLVALNARISEFPVGPTPVADPAR